MTGVDGGLKELLETIPNISWTLNEPVSQVYVFEVRGYIFKTN